MAVPENSAAASSRPSAAAVPENDATVISAGADGDRSSVSRPAPQPGRSPTAEIGRLLEGKMLGPYRLDEFVGGGGMGAVFRALDTTLDRTVAVKVLARRESDDEETLRRFRNEAQSAARLDHENIGRVHAVGSEGGWHYIVFEFIEGTNLRDFVREHGPFDPGRTIDVAIQVADALEHASEREIVHRDIKPSNIVITPAGRARIVDMGLARLHHVAGDADLTVSGMTLGTFDYISPEQARDPRAADVRSDLYSLGCTMFFMLVGRAPFAEGTMVQKLLQHQQAEPPAIDGFRQDVPRRLAAIIGRLMEKDPLDRYQRPAVLIADLAACAEAEGLSLTQPRPPAFAPAEDQPDRSRIAWLVPALLLAALVAALWMRSVSLRRGGEESRSDGSGAGPAVIQPGEGRLQPGPGS
jgi:serine/threonine protein kinase